MTIAHRLTRTALALAGTIAVLGSGAWLGSAAGMGAAHAAPAPPQRATDGQEAYPQRSTEGEVPIGDSLSVNGQPMQLSLFFTADPPARVIAWYTDVLTKKGLIPLPQVDEQVGHVSVFDPDDGLQHFVTALPQGDGQTLVMVGVTNPRRPPRLITGAKHAPFPVPEEHRGFLSYASEDAGVKSQNAQFVSSLSIAQVGAFYRKSLTADGYAEQPADSTEAMILFRKGQVTLSVALQALDAKGGSAVFVNRIDGGAR